jgi:hypothetical protein
LKANVDRWRGQIGLAPLGSEELLAKLITPLEVDGVKGTLVEIPATDGKSDPQTGKRTVALIRSKGDRTWFVKLTGDDAAVTQQKANFLQFVLNLRFPHA